MSESKDVVNWQERLAKEAKAVAATERPSVSRISLRGGAMSMGGQVIKGGTIDVIVLATVQENAYYPNRFDPNKIEAPDCFAFSEDGVDMVPHEKAFNKQSETCTTCPQFQWGSDENSPSKKGKACKQKRKLLLLPGDTLKTGKFKDAELAIMDIPTTSVKNWGQYVQMLAATEGRPPWAMLTKITLSPDPRNQIRVDFEPLFPIGEEHLGAVAGRAEASRNLIWVPYEKTTEGLSDTTEKMQSGKKY